MPRIARVLLEGAWNHVHAKVAGVSGDYVLGDKECQRKLFDIIRHFSKAYCCEVGSVCIMGNHWHGVIRFEAPRAISDDELVRRAKALYPNSYKLIKEWEPCKWDRLEKRLFDISEFMRNVQSAFARWYNKKHKRMGRFWADRFKNTVLGDLEAVLDCMLYVELNPVRAGIVKKPEDFEGSSAFLREIGKDEWLTSLTNLLGRSNKDAWQEYKSLLYHRGSIPTKEKQCKISQELLEEEKARGFKSKGVYRKRLRYFTDGVVIGSDELIRKFLSNFRDKGRYLRRNNPIPQLRGDQFSLREQRGHALHLE